MWLKDTSHTFLMPQIHQIKTVGEKKIKKMRNQLVNGITSLSLQYSQFHLSENPRNKI